MGMLRVLCPLWQAVLTSQLYKCHAGSWLNLTEEMTEHYPFPAAGRSLLLCQMLRCAADAACSWGGGHTSFTLQIMVPPRETVKGSIWKGNWGKFSWMSEAGEGCRALGVKALLENLKWFHDVQTPWSRMCASWLEGTSAAWNGRETPKDGDLPAAPSQGPTTLLRKKLFDQMNQNLPKSTAVSSWYLPVLRCTPLWPAGQKQHWAVIRVKY